MGFTSSTNTNAPDMCEYCCREVTPLYSWHADLWCADCIADAPPSMFPMIGTLADAPVGRPDHPDYAQPFIWTPEDRH